MLNFCWTCKFHPALFSRCNTDLGDNDVEMTVVRGVQYNPPSGYAEKDLDTYIKYEFPFPTVCSLHFRDFYKKQNF